MRLVNLVLTQNFVVFQKLELKYQIKKQIIEKCIDTCACIYQSAKNKAQIVKADF